MCAVFFIGKIDTIYQNINQITVVLQTINVALNKVVEKENYFVLCRYPMEDFFFCDVLFGFTKENFCGTIFKIS